MNRTGPMTLMLCLALVGCADKKESKDAAPQDEGSLSPIVGESHKVEVDATSKEAFAGFDFDSGKVLTVADLAAGDTSWDLAFKRTVIKMNGDAVKMQIVSGDYAALTEAPKDGYKNDQPSPEAGALETAGLAFHDPAWYSYDITVHVVSSANLVYVVESNEGKHFKLKFLDYYNTARLPAYVNFEYQEIEVAQ